MEFARLTGDGGLARIVARFCADFAWARDTSDHANIDKPLRRAEELAEAAKPKPKPRTAAAELRILSHNTWGIPISPFCHERHVALCKALFGASEQRCCCRYDIITLQEVWHRRERELLIREAARAGLAHHHYFEPGCGFPLWSGVEGTGLMVLSRFPIACARYHRFSVSGCIYKLHEADYLGAKGAGCCRVATPWGRVDVCTTHLLSAYCAASGSASDEYFALRACQAFELGQMLDCSSAHAPAPLLVLSGDFNMEPDTLVGQLPQQIAGLRDSFVEAAAPCLGAGAGGAAAAAATYGAADNCFSAGDAEARMDLVLYKAREVPNAEAGGGGAQTWHPVDARLVKLTARLTDTPTPNGEELPLSDHFGAEATFRLVPSEGVSMHTKAATEPADQLLAQAHQLARTQARKTYEKRQRCWSRAYAALGALVAALVWEASAPAHALSLRQRFPALGPLLWVVLTHGAVLFFLYGHFVVGDELAAVKELAQQMRVRWQALQGGYA